MTTLLVRRALVWTLCAVAGVGAVRPALAAPGLPDVHAAAGQDAVQVIDVPLRGRRDIPIPGVTAVVVVDDAICRAELIADGLSISGIRRGDSVVFAWVDDRRLTLLVRVEPVAPPPSRPDPAPEQLARLGLGHLTTSAQTHLGPDRRATQSYQHAFGWAQQVDDRRLSLRGQARHTSQPEAPFNIDTASLQYTSPGLTVTALDFSLRLNGGTDARVTAFSPVAWYTLRGLDVTMRRGQADAGLFAGTSIPASYRSLRGTTRVAGATLAYRVSPRLRLHSTTVGISAPGIVAGAGTIGAPRDTSVFTTAGLTYRADDRWATHLTGGTGSGGFYGDGAVALTGDRLSGSAAVTAVSPAFALNRLQLLSAGGTSLRANGTWRVSSRLGASVFVQHSETRPTPLFPAFAGRADYVNPAVSLTLSSSHSLTLSGVYSRSRDGLSAEGVTRQQAVDAGWNARLFDRVTNTLQVSRRVSDDPEQGRSGPGLGVRNSLNVRLGSGSLTFALQGNREDPSLVSRLRQQLSLLPPDLQDRFLADPLGFVQSDLLPADVRDLLDALTATRSQATIAGQFRIGRRLNLGASYGRLRHAVADTRRTTTDVFGYALAWDLTPDLQFRSSLSETWLIDARQPDPIRTTTFQVGLHVNFRGGPALLPGTSRDYRISGRVFVDRDVTGTPGDTEPGLGGILVRLDNGRTAVTDSTGRYEFRGLKAAAYQLALPLDQFTDPVRVTTAARHAVNLLEQPQATADFGVVNFSRVWGTVFNDYALEDTRRADSPGLDGVALTVTGEEGLARQVRTDGSGIYRLDDLTPGTYRIEVDPATIPPNYLHLAGATTITVQPVRTMVVDVPVRALRSVSGHVYMAANGGAQGPSALVPAAGLTVVAGRAEATTDANGFFILRDLPAGDLSVTVRPDRPLPPGLSPPTGAIRMPKDPIAVEGATIVIRNPALIDYLAPRRGTMPPGR